MTFPLFSDQFTITQGRKDVPMQRFNVVYGLFTGKGGWRVRAMDVIEAPSEDVAYAKAEYIAHKYKYTVLELFKSPTYV